MSIPVTARPRRIGTDPITKLPRSLEEMTSRDVSKIPAPSANINTNTLRMVEASMAAFAFGTSKRDIELTLDSAHQEVQTLLHAGETITSIRVERANGCILPGSLLMSVMLREGSAGDSNLTETIQAGMAVGLLNESDFLEYRTTFRRTYRNDLFIHVDVSDRIRDWSLRVILSLKKKSPVAPTPSSSPSGNRPIICGTCSLELPSSRTREFAVDSRLPCSMCEDDGRTKNRTPAALPNSDSSRRRVCTACGTEQCFCDR